MSDLSDKTTIVVGASRGLGHGIATAFAEAGAPVVAVSRTAAEFPEPVHGAGTIQPEIADAAGAEVAGSLLDRYKPQVVVLVARASPHMRPLQEQTWETFSVNWRPMSGSPSAGSARRCSSRCRPAAGWSSSAAVRRLPAHR
jgi:NAD(P)-dependent dehydrogenase (short-subunit alcohol dehydrogenase family)